MDEQDYGYNDIRGKQQIITSKGSYIWHLNNVIRNGQIVPAPYSYTEQSPNTDD